jgi:hypothetical protein
MTRLPPSGAQIEVATVTTPSCGASRHHSGEVWDNPSQAGGNSEEPPTGFDWQQEPHHILEVCNRWRVHARWWEREQAVWREYFKVTTDRGLLCLIYHDLQSGDWFLSRIYD